MHRPQAVLCDVALLLFLLFAAKLSATDILFSAEILGLRSREQRESSLFFRRSSLFVTREAMRKPGPRETARRSFNYT
jgi:hypothetical protein